MYIEDAALGILPDQVQCQRDGAERQGVQHEAVTRSIVRLTHRACWARRFLSYPHFASRLSKSAEHREKRHGFEIPGNAVELQSQRTHLSELSFAPYAKALRQLVF